VTVDLYKDFLHKLSNFLHIEGVLNEGNNKKKNKDDPSNSYFY
jgi:hypothetical protein